VTTFGGFVAVAEELQVATHRREYVSWIRVDVVSSGGAPLWWAHRRCLPWWVAWLKRRRRSRCAIGLATISTVPTASRRRRRLRRSRSSSESRLSHGRRRRSVDRAPQGPAYVSGGGRQPRRPWRRHQVTLDVQPAFTMRQDV